MPTPVKKIAIKPAKLATSKAAKAKAKAKAKPAKLPSKREASAEMIRALSSTRKGTDYAPHWSPLQTAIFDFIRHGSGSGMVKAGAGSGKTTTICEGVRYMRGSVIAIAFNTSIAGELKERLAGFPNVLAGTAHKIGKMALESANVAGWVKVDGDKLQWIFKDNLETKTNWIAKGNACKLCTLAKDSGAGIDFRADDREAWEKIAEHFSVPASQNSRDGNETFDIIAMAQKLLTLSNNDFRPMKNGKKMLRIDFADMVYLPILWNLPFQKFEWVVVDEAQDLNLMRRLLVKALSGETTRHLIVGDTFQAIYGFTGADADSMENMRKAFNCQSFPLSVCYRCASSIVEFAQQWNPEIEASPSAPVGEITALDYAKAMEAPAQTFRASDVILCRNNAPNVKTAMQFIRANIPVRVEGADLTKQLCELAETQKAGAGNLLKFRQAVIEAGEEKVAQAQAKGRNGKAGAFQDLTETLLVFIDRAIETSGNYEEMISMIKGFFSPVEKNGEASEVLTISTIHKAKGREWSRVFWLGRAQFQPSKFAKLEWELGQEKNLCYVAATRAKLILTELTDFPA